MAKLTVKSVDSPDETRAPEKTKVEVVDLGDGKAARITLQGYEFESTTAGTYAQPT